MSIMILVLVQAIKPHIYLPQIWVKGNLFEFKKEEEEENLRIDCKIMVNQPSCMLFQVKFCVWDSIND